MCRETMQLAPEHKIQSRVVGNASVNRPSSDAIDVFGTHCLARRRLRLIEGLPCRMVNSLVPERDCLTKLDGAAVGEFSSDVHNLEPCPLKKRAAFASCIGYVSIMKSVFSLAARRTLPGM